MKHKLFTTLLVMLMSMAGSNALAQDYDVSAENDDGITIYYKLINEGSELEVVKGDGYSASTIRIPAEVNSKPVVRIGESAFGSCHELLLVTIPSSVISIADDAFYGCKNLSILNLSSGLRSIGGSAFGNCKSLKNVILPNSVENIGDFAFYCCDIESINIPSSVSHIGHNPFCGNKNLISITVSPYNSYYDSRNNCNCIIESNTKKLITIAKDISVPNFIKIIGQGTFARTESTALIGVIDIDLLSLPEGLEEIETLGLSYLHIGRLNVPSSILKLTTDCFWGCYIDSLDISDLKAWCEAVESRPLDGGIAYLYQNGIIITDLVIPSGTTKIGSEIFCNILGVNSMTIPNSVTNIGSYTLPANLTSLIVERTLPLPLSASIGGSNVTLYVPRGCKAAYEAADYWKDFKEIKEYGDGNATITMGSSGIMTYSNNSDLNFTSVSGLKAYIASGFNPATGNLTMTRVYEVPAGEGLILKGAANSYEVPYEETSAYYANLLVGVPTATTVSPTDGSYTNFILANDAVKGIGFYPLASAGEIGPNKAYLQLPTSILPAAARSLRMVFEDEEEEVTGVNALNDKCKMKNDKAVYDLQGRRVTKPTRGLYIKDGKKIMVK